MDDVPESVGKADGRTVDVDTPESVGKADGRMVDGVPESVGGTVTDVPGLEAGKAVGAVETGVGAGAA